MIRAVLLALCLVGGGAAEARAPERTYATDGVCAGLPRTKVETVQGACMGLVWQGAAGDTGPRMPRKLLPLAKGDWLVTDLGGWEAGRGALWRLSFDRGDRPVWRRLTGGLTMPHTVAAGPDGRVYVAEMSRIFALDPDRPETAATVVGDLPDNRLHDNRHPLSSFVFDADGALLVNVGAPSDRCLDSAGRAKSDQTGGCIESADRAQVRRYPYLGNGRWSPRWTVYASGLRNSVAMVRHASGALFQAENSVDLPDSDRPYDEINRLRAGAHYGWPYCTDMGEPLPGWPAAVARCGERTRPVSLLPPHAAPLDLLYYEATLFPELRGRMLVSWHGYRRAGARLVAIETDGEGAPLTDRPARYAIWPRGSRPYPVDAPGPRGRVLTPGWNRVKGDRPAGAPVGLAVAPDGSIWIADDRNAAILRFARDDAP